MIKKILLSGICLLSLVGCEKKQEQDQILMHEDGRSKPKVALFNIYDHSLSSLPWDLSLEFTHDMTEKLKALGTLFVLNQDDLNWNTEVDFEKVKPYRDGHFLKDAKPNADFVVCIEMIEHMLVPLAQKQNVAHPNAQTHELIVKARLKVYDIRSIEPKVILSEILSETSTVPWQLATVDYRKNHYKTNHYKITPVGLTHKKLMQTMTKRLQDYILLSKG
jgi:hypothetical protein